jgi:hypothetical protein
LVQQWELLSARLALRVLLWAALPLPVLASLPLRLRRWLRLLPLLGLHLGLEFPMSV